MRTELFDYDLPEQHIARHPTVDRDGARMLVVERENYRDDRVRNWWKHVPTGSLVVLNDTRVRKARLLGNRRGSGGRVEFLLLARRTAADTGAKTELWEALARPLRALKPGCLVDTPGISVQIGERLDDGKVLVQLDPAEGESVDSALENHGHMPIPPYLGRDDEPEDAERYQTVFAQYGGSAAAPTAGLHLTPTAISGLVERGVDVGYTTLHVGLGTFRKVSVDDLDDHPMHTETFQISGELVGRVAAARARGGRVYAVGTTVVRALESARDPARPGHVLELDGATNLLIQPGYRFQVVDGLLTNFHQPRSTLLSLVAAAIGLRRLREAYAIALERGYRFLSYGDAMWIPEVLQ